MSGITVKLTQRYDGGNKVRIYGLTRSFLFEVNQEVYLDASDVEDLKGSTVFEAFKKLPSVTVKDVPDPTVNSGTGTGTGTGTATTTQPSQTPSPAPAPVPAITPAPTPVPKTN